MQVHRYFKDRIYFFYKYKLLYILYQKYAVLEQKNLFIDNVVIEYKGSTISEEDLFIINVTTLLETITGKRSNMVGKYKYIGATKKFFFMGFVKLKKEELFIFLNYLSTCCIPGYVKRNGITDKGIRSIFKVTDLSIFYNFKVINLTGLINLKFSGKQTQYSLVHILNVIKIQ